MFDTGTSTGEIIGHSKAINAVTIRQQRPFRAATAGDDNLIVFHQGSISIYLIFVLFKTKNSRRCTLQICEGIVYLISLRFD
jgi:hypothetical protein